MARRQGRASGQPTTQNKTFETQLRLTHPRNVASLIGTGMGLATHSNALNAGGRGISMAMRSRRAGARRALQKAHRSRGGHGNRRTLRDSHGRFAGSR